MFTELVRRKIDGKMFAMKVLQKQNIQKECKAEQIIAEKNIMKQLKSPFIVQLHYAFQSVNSNRKEN